MSDADVFARFVYEMRTLLTAIESHVVSIGAGLSSDRQAAALSEMARLSNAAAALAEAFDVDDVRDLARAMTQAAQDKLAASRTEPLAPLGAHDALAYMKWRVERIASADKAEPLTESDRTLALRLEQQLTGAPPSTRTSASALPATLTLSGVDELTPEELAIVQAFPRANLRRRDERADTPAFIAKTASGADVPVYGGLTAEELDEIPPEMKRIFVKETQADLRELGQLMVDFEQRASETALDNMGYIAHKLKGSAATMGFDGFASIAICFEEALKASQGTELASDAAYFAGLGRFLDLFQRALEAAAALEEPAPELVEDARRLRASMTRAQVEHDGQHTHLPAPLSSAELTGERSHPSAHDLVLHIEAPRLDMLMNQLSALAANRGAVTRNRSEILRAQAEMQAALSRLREKSTQIADAHPLTYDNLLSSAQQGSGGAAIPSVWRPDAVQPVSAAPTPSGALRATWNNLQLEQYTEVDTALRALAEVVADVHANYSALATLLNRLGQLTEAQETITREIQADAMDIRLAKLAEIMPRLRISANVAASNLSKRIEFEAQGETIEIDRLLLEALVEPLIQLLRNAIAHGVEGPQEREEAGKPAVGKVWVYAYNAGNEVVIEVGDDGRGVNTDQLVEAAISAKLLPAEEATRLSQEQALRFMFQLGITTLKGSPSDHVGALAGSGIGLANVASTIRSLKGDITVRSEAGKGTTFQVRVPISLSMVPVLEIHAGGQVYALPFAMVESTGIVAPERLREVTPAGPQTGDRLREWRVMLDKGDASSTPAPDEATESESASTPARAHEIPAYALAETLGFEQDAAALRRMVVIQAQGQMVALLVESVGSGDVREAAVRPLPQPLQRRVARGIVVRPEDGEVALLIDPQEALTQRLSSANMTLRPATLPARVRSPLPYVLIVDDSVTIRHTLEQTLTGAGFRTRQAHDGYEALELLEQELPRVVILDVEMPRLSGFELLTIMRSSPQYQGVRVAMLTSRAADKHREYAMAIGADAYLVKPCPQETLVETIRRLLSESEPA